MTPKVKSGTSRQVLKRLEEWDSSTSHSSKSLKFYKKLLNIRADVESRIISPKVKIRKEVIASRTTSGLPLLRFEELEFDWPLVEDTFVRTETAFTNYREDLGQVLQKPTEQKPRLRKETIEAWFEDNRLPAEAVSDNVSEHLLATIIPQTMMPFLASYAQVLIGAVDQELWQRGYCPVCGGIPDFAFLEKEVGARWLLCSRCDAQWLFRRLVCPYCGNNDHKSLSYFVGENGPYRLYVCEQCHCYLKTIDLRKVEDTADILLPLERLITIDMEHQGQEKGYKPGTYIGH